MNPTTPHRSRTKGSKLGLGLVAVLSGCASYANIAEYPTPTQPVQITVATGNLSGRHLPSGTYYDQQHQVLVRDSEGGTRPTSGNYAGIATAVGGVIAGGVVLAAKLEEEAEADEAARSAAKSRLDAAASGWAIDLVTLAREALKEETARQPTPAGATPGGTPATPAAQLQLSPYAVFTVLASGKACLHAMVGAQVLRPGGRPTWSVRYFARAPGEYTVEGVDGWMGETRFADGMHVALRRAVRAAIDDSHGRLTLHRTVNAQGQFPYTGGMLPMIVVQTNKSTDVARMVLPDGNPLSGTHVLDRADFVLFDAGFADPRY